MRYGLGPGTILEAIVIDADREMSDANFSFFKTDDVHFAARKNLCVRHDTAHALENIPHIAPGLESEQIELQQSAKKPPLLRQFRKNVIRRERDV